MRPNLDELRFVARADVYKAGTLAGHLAREADGTINFDYTDDYVARSETDFPAVATTLPRQADSVSSSGGALPAFFAGLLPEGHRLTVLRAAVKTSLNDELTLLLAVGGDAPGDVQVVPGGTVPSDPNPVARFTDSGGLDFTKLADARIITDLFGRHALLVTRFDRQRQPSGSWLRLPLEDATQVLNLPPSAKYQVSTEAAISALANLCAAKPVAIRNLYLQFIYSWLTGNGDLHAKNISVLASPAGPWKISPVYDVPCTLLYGDDSLALTVAGKTKNLKARHWAELANDIGLPPKAAEAANARALRAAEAVDLTTLGLTGSPLNGAVRELTFRRHELAG